MLRQQADSFPILANCLPCQCISIRLHAAAQNRSRHFSHPDLLRWVRTERLRFLDSALTILHAYEIWLPTARPLPQLAPMDEFQEWSDAVRAPLLWQGQADPFRGQTKG
jgi:hypothetical protein